MNHRKRARITLLSAVLIAIMMGVALIAVPVKFQSWRVAHADPATHAR